MADEKVIDAIEVREQGSLSIADDSGFLLQVARQAEERIDAVVKIKKMALKVTNSSDWVDQNGKPYLQVSGSEKIANLFNVSWTIDEPLCEIENSGHFTYTYKGCFKICGRSIEVNGSRSSKDPFFKRYDWVTPEGGGQKQKVEKPISEIDKRDVKMAAMTNLLGNGITRLLGIRNLTYADLMEFAGIEQSQLGKVEYKKKKSSKPSVAPPQETPPVQDGQQQGEVVRLISELQRKRLFAIRSKSTKSEPELKEYLLTLGLDSTSKIPCFLYEQVVDWVEGKE